MEIRVLKDLAHLYEEAGNQIAVALPAGWKTAWVQVEMEEDNGSVACFYVTSAPSSKPAYCPTPMELYDIFKEMRQVAAANDEAWTTATFILRSDGTFDIEYGYDPAPLDEISDRRKAWKEKYLPR